jgi:hypothetical protein
VETGKMLALKIDRVDNLVGMMDVMDESFHAAPTVWSAITSMGADVQELVKRKVQLPAVDLQPTQARVNATEANLHQAITHKIKLQIEALVSGVGARIGKAEKAVVHINSKPSGPGLESELESALMSSGGGRRTPSHGSQPNNGDLVDRVKKLEKLLLEMYLRVHKVIADNNASCIKFGGLGISNEAETGTWILTHYADMYYTLIFDAYSILGAIEDEGPGNQSDLLRDMKKRDDLSVNGVAKGQAPTAHLHEISRIFHGPGGKLVGLDSADTHLSKVLSYKHWSYGSHCLKRKIESELVKVRYANRLIINQHFKLQTWNRSPLGRSGVARQVGRLDYQLGVVHRYDV